MLCDISGSMEPYARATCSSSTCAAGSGPGRRGVRVRDAPDAADPGARDPQPRPRDPPRRRGGAGLVERDADRRGAEGLQRPARPPRHGARRRGRDPLGRLGARRPEPRRARDGAPAPARPPRSSGSTRGPPRRASRVQAAGMVAALPYCDALVSGHSFDALERGRGGDRERRRPPRRRRGVAGAPAGGRGALAERDTPRRQLGGDAERIRPRARQDDSRLERRDDAEPAGGKQSASTRAANVPLCRRTRSAGRSRRSATSRSTTRSPPTRSAGASSASVRRSAQAKRGGIQPMANEAYRAVFLRVHPTGKMVLSLTTESDGRESQYAEIVAAELGVPPLDVKVVAADTDRFGVGHGFNTSPSPGTAGAIGSRRRQDPRQGSAARGRGARGRAREPALGQRRLGRRRGGFARAPYDRRARALRARHRPAAARRRGRARRPDRLPRLSSQAPASSGPPSKLTVTSSATFSAPNSAE